MICPKLIKVRIVTCPKVIKNYVTCPKLSKCQQTILTCSKIGKVSCNLLDFHNNSETWFHDWRRDHESLENYIKLHFKRTLLYLFQNLIYNQNIIV